MNLKKFISAAVGAAMLISTVSIFLLATAASAKAPTVLVLGDSISTGYGLSDTNNSYASLFADYCGAECINEAKNGLMAEELKIGLENGNYDTELSKADYVFVTIGENDIFSPIVEIFLNVTKKYGYNYDTYTNFKELLDVFDFSNSKDQQMWDDFFNELSQNISPTQISKYYVKPCFDYISEHTSGKVVFQTVYNPFSIDTSSSEWAPYKSCLDMLNIKMSLYCDSMKKYYERYAKSYDNIQILDTYTNFANHGETLTNIEDMDIHPNQAGHLYLAADIISFLDEKKVSDEKIKSSYNSLKEPYKSNLLKIDNARSKILNAINSEIETTLETYAPVSALPKTSELTQGDKIKIIVTGGDENYKFVASDNERVVISPDGTVTALRPGIVKITIVDGVGNTDSVTITIIAFTQPITESQTIITTEELSETESVNISVIYGDINLDGKVTIADAVLINKYLVKSATLTDIQLKAADCLLDKQVNSSDTLAILKLIVGTCDSLPVNT